MEIVRGKSRTVILFKRFVLKFPRMHLKYVYEMLWHHYQGGDLIRYLKYGMEVSGSPRRMLFRGGLHNWHEFVFFIFNRSPFLVPTYFSLLGLLNIQKRGDKAKIKNVDLWCQLCEMTKNAVHVDGHSFSNSNNFCEKDGHLMIADYGDPKIRGVLKKYGDKIFRDFDFTYVYAERARNK